MKVRSVLGGIAGAALLHLGPAGYSQSPSGREQFAVDRGMPVRPAAGEVLPSLPLRLPGPPRSEGRSGYHLDDLTRLGLENHPRLAQAGLAVEAARGRALQAGLYPNPTISATFDELGDRQGRGGINTVPLITQEVVTGGKLGLNRAAADREVDQATLALASRRAELLAAIRGAYFDLLGLQRRVELLRELVVLTGRSVEHTRRLVQAKQAAELDVIQLEVEAERVRAEAEAAEKELPAAFRRLAAVLGVKDLPEVALAGSLDDGLPDYDLDRLRAYVLSVHPEVRSAQVGLDRAKLLWQRARAEPIPNVTVSGGYVRQNQNRSDDWTVGVSVPVPVWNRNQGNIQAALAEVGSAAKEVQRVENDLTDRVAVAYRDYAAARKRAERFAVVRRKAQEAFRLVTDEKNFTLTAVQRLVAQQAVTQASLEYVRALTEAWRSASTLSGLTLEDEWPAAPTQENKMVPAPNPKTPNRNP